MVNNINGNSFHKKREDFNNSEILSKSSSYNARERELYNVPCLRPVVVMRDVVARTKCVDEVCVCFWNEICSFLLKFKETNIFRIMTILSC